MLGSDVGGWTAQRPFDQTKWLREFAEAAEAAEAVKIKRSVETSALMASSERLITKQMHNSKTTKIVPFTDEELDWLLSSAT